mgnify:CR=1 FL=1
METSQKMKVMMRNALFGFDVFSSTKRLSFLFDSNQLKVLVLDEAFNRFGGDQVVAGSKIRTKALINSFGLWKVPSGPDIN